jgi:hypothetical protein
MGQGKQWLLSTPKAAPAAQFSLVLLGLPPLALRLTLFPVKSGVLHHSLWFSFPCLQLWKC